MLDNIPEAIKREVERKYAMFLKLPIIAQILSQLSTSLDAGLVYHNLSHTEEVLREAILFAEFARLPLREIELLAIAAAYHDSGFLKQKIDNEVLGANLAEVSMNNQGGFSEEEIKLVKNMILDTRIVERPEGRQQIAGTSLSAYLLDADLSNFGRDDFFDRLEFQRRESRLSQQQAYQMTLELMQSHQWKTDAARNLRQDKKIKNLKRLQKLAEGGND